MKWHKDKPIAQEVRYVIEVDSSPIFKNRWTVYMRHKNGIAIGGKNHAKRCLALRAAKRLAEDLRGSVVRVEG